MIFLAPLHALSLVQQAWPGTVRNAVYMTSEEWKEWNEVYQPSDEGFWWHALQWWSIECEIPELSIWFLEEKPVFPPGIMPMLVTYGLMWGDMAGGETADLWSWDSERETFIENLGGCDF